MNNTHAYQLDKDMAHKLRSPAMKETIISLGSEIFLSIKCFHCFTVIVYSMTGGIFQ